MCTKTQALQAVLVKACGRILNLLVVHNKELYIVSWMLLGAYSLHEDIMPCKQVQRAICEDLECYKKLEVSVY